MPLLLVNQEILATWAVLQITKGYSPTKIMALKVVKSVVGCGNFSVASVSDSFGFASIFERALCTGRLIVMFLLNYKFLLSLGLGIITFGTGCQSPSSGGSPVISLTRSAVSIESLRQPEKIERSLPLKGSVMQQLSILNGALYQLDDGTGQVWVLTQQAAPSVGERVYIKGILRYEPIVIHGADLGDYYLEEKQRELQTPNS